MLDLGELAQICESKSRFAVKSVDAHAEFALQPIENIRRTKAALLRPVCWVKPILNCGSVTSCFPGQIIGENAFVSKRKRSAASPLAAELFV